MAQRKGMTLRMDNSDDAQREYEISCEVTVEQGKARDVRAINVSREGQAIAYGTVSRLDGDTPSVSLNIQKIPLTDHKQVIDTVYAFVVQTVEEVNEEE